MNRVSVTRTACEVPANPRVRAKRAPVSKRVRRAFLDLLATGYSVSAAATVAGVHRQRLYELETATRCLGRSGSRRSKPEPICSSKQHGKSLPGVLSRRASTRPADWCRRGGGRIRRRSGSCSRRAAQPSTQSGRAWT